MWWAWCGEELRNGGMYSMYVCTYSTYTGDILSNNPKIDISPYYLLQTLVLWPGSPGTVTVRSSSPFFVKFLDSNIQYAVMFVCFSHRQLYQELCHFDLYRVEPR